MKNVIRVAAGSNVGAVAGLIVANLMEEQDLVFQAIGVKAVYQLVKASATAQRRLETLGKVAMNAEFIEVEINGDVRTAIRFQVHLATMEPVTRSNTLDGSVR